MTEASGEEKVEDVSRGPAAVMLIFSCWLAMPTLWFAWNHDRYSRGGMWAFVLWLVTLVYLLYRGRGEKKPSTLLWLLGAVGCCSMGGIFSVNLLYHLGLAFSCLALLHPYRNGLMLLGGALVWMPAAGWLVSRVMAGGFVGWERPLAALLVIAAFLSWQMLSSTKKIP